MKQTHNWKKSESESPLPYPYYIFVPNAHPPISTSRLVFPPQGAPALALHLKLNWDLHIVSLQLGIAPGIAMNLHFNYVMVTTREIIKQISWVEPHVWVYLIFVVRVLWAVLVYKVWLSVKKSRRTRKCRNQGQFSSPSIFCFNPAHHAVSHWWWWKLPLISNILWPHSFQVEATHSPAQYILKPLS